MRRIRCIHVFSGLGVGRISICNLRCGFWNGEDTTAGFIKIYSASVEAWRALAETAPPALTGMEYTKS